MGYPDRVISKDAAPTMLPQAAGLPEVERAMEPTAPAALRLAPEILRPLQRVNRWRSLGAVASTWGLIAAAIFAALGSGHWLAWVGAALVVGRCQHALAVLMHDAAHFRMLDDRRWNDFVGHWLCARPIASHLYLYRFVHLRHHKNLHTPQDPDLSLSVPFPCGRSSWHRKLVRDLTGISALVMRGYLRVDRETGRMTPSRGNLLIRWTRRTAIERGVVLALVAGAIAAGLGWAILFLWVLPLLVVYQTLLRLRGVLEHAAVPDKTDPLRNARTVVRTNPLAAFFLNPHHVAFHLEHHLYPGVPHYHLPSVHRALQATGRFGSALVEHRYAQSFASIIGK